MLRPRQDFEELFQRTPTTRQDDEAICEVCHHCFSDMHRRDDPKI